ncbi:MAG: DUF2807 domain-containing protein [Muribaculaceae bacterium]|nr:DUF2807 domain-containing protein [Muribaculaceae bacterium]
MNRFLSFLLLASLSLSIYARQPRKKNPEPCGIEVHTIRNVTVDNIRLNYSQTPGIEIDGRKITGSEEGIRIDGGSLIITQPTDSWGHLFTRSGDIIINTPCVRDIYMHSTGDLTSEKIVSDKLNISIFGAGDVKVVSIQADYAELSVYGAGSIKVSGIESDNVKVRVLGAGDVTLGNIKANRIDCVMSGAGDAVLYGIDCTYLKVVSLGAGDISLNGYAENTSVQLRGSGDVTSRDMTSRHTEISTTGSGSIKGIFNSK